jgi:hypothetical protein
MIRGREWAGGTGACRTGAPAIGAGPPGFFKKSAAKAITR